ncbi:MAG TPA: hypothetical protein VFX28_22970 [Methylomirabilota bacterium]|nr:hypothetical protein [Methylomirabilota bacterium]
MDPVMLPKLLFVAGMLVLGVVTIALGALAGWLLERRRERAPHPRTVRAARPQARDAPRSRAA